MAGMLALLDDVAGIVKIAAAGVDDVIGQAAKASAKSAGALIDDAAVTPKYVVGLSANRELPVIWRIAKGSLKNKILYLLPVGLALSAFAPWAIPLLLMIGGAYLCFEGAEKIAHVLGWSDGHEDYQGKAQKVARDPAMLEEQKAKGAIKTDFILSAEIMTISLAAIPQSNFLMEAATLATVAIMITTVVYGSVALIVKADDLGLTMAANGRLDFTRSLGRGIVKIMPGFMRVLTIVGTAAMLWVGGSIVIHGLAELGCHEPEHLISATSSAVGGYFGDAAASVGWVIRAAFDGVLGACLGLAFIPIGQKIITPFWRLLARHTV